ncbi:MAG: cellulose biosynthesis protein BcsR [Gammaproteobacteria bacterium]|uniref:cellulose biosynthesis protein BcsR n=1 Tax=Pseudomonas sp. Hp2 TaxID=701189 RepID=UPI00112A309E|nr:cellulose biosynthesis protein BcsR [Pseudomonas sp. Hp2]
MAEKPLPGAAGPNGAVPHPSMPAAFPAGAGAQAALQLPMGEDDVGYLRRRLDIQDLPYVDFSARRECAQALARWPLLAELSALDEGGAGR